jgi:hypothetical protein
VAIKIGYRFSKAVYVDSGYNLYQQNSKAYKTTSTYIFLLATTEIPIQEGSLYTAITKKTSMGF